MGIDHILQRTVIIGAERFNVKRLGGESHYP